MSYDARVFNVMIASPSDVASERMIVRDVIYEWNAVHSEEKKIVLLPVGWESHSSPEMGDRPQAIINRHTLDKCDLLVGIFGIRIGTDTGEYLSGTVEEIEKHIKLKKPAMLYFSERLGDRKDFDQEQYVKREEWRKKCESRGLYQNYKDESDFKKKFSRQLQIKINEHDIFQVRAQKSDVDSEMEESEDDRIHRLSEEAKTLLKEASQDKNGSVTFLICSGPETLIETNEKNMIPDQNPRVVAKWKAALEALVNTGLLEDRGYKGEVFQVTNRGYQIADRLAERE